ncbi:MAG: lipocalin-like domain-containing protein [Pseudoruegeria sp.]
MVQNSPLVGTWSLLTWFNETSEGHRIYPLGKEAEGFISYTSDGFVFVQMVAKNRTLYTVNDPFGGTLEEDSAAIKSQISYSGSYEDKGDHVIHRVKAASCPNWIGTEQIRQVTFDGDSLSLSAVGTRFQGQNVNAYLDWTRADPSSPL